MVTYKLTPYEKRNAIEREVKEQVRMTESKEYRKARKEHERQAQVAGIRATLEKGREMDAMHERKVEPEGVKSAAELLMEAREIAESIDIIHMPTPSEEEIALLQPIEDNTIVAIEIPSGGAIVHAIVKDSDTSIDTGDGAIYHPEEREVAVLQTTDYENMTVDELKARLKALEAEKE